MTHIALEAASALEKEGIHAEVVDLRSLRPLDEDTIVHSVRKTHRCVVVHEGWPYGGVGAEICDRVQRLAFDWLDGADPAGDDVRRTDAVQREAGAALHPAGGAGRDGGDKAPHDARPGANRAIAATDTNETARLRWRKSSRCRSSPPRWKRGFWRPGIRRRGTRSPSTTSSPTSRPDKATMEFRAFDKGTLLKILVGPGSEGSTRPAGGRSRRKRGRRERSRREGGVAGERPQRRTRAPRPARKRRPRGRTRKPPPHRPHPLRNRREARLRPSPRHRLWRRPRRPRSRRRSTKARPSIRTTRDAAATERRSNGDVMASPYVRKTARDLGINLQGAKVGSGPGGRIVAGDLGSR